MWCLQQNARRSLAGRFVLLVEVAGWRNPPLHQQLKPINLLDFFPFLGQKIDTSLDTFIVARYLDAGMNPDDLALYALRRLLTCPRKGRIHEVR
jgi:hypothetical protein